MRFVHAGCGVNALSGLQNLQIQYIARRPDKRSSSGSFAFVISLMPGEIRAYSRIQPFYTVNPNIIPVSSCSSRWQCAI
ncbi:hypothetical protein D9M08_15245 [Escherichia albertii]|nr:hypothetical protein [Escherichia albertii]EEW0787218.1 hypothetical protein [Escherichia albertii]EEW4358990.1 hypothetical protein [Escherichia albertii]EEW6709888.1 hypothetical protein [Escherichia albertii]EEW7550841.1 hypothetical protein [Escherichia albertii]